MYTENLIHRAEIAVTDSMAERELEFVDEDIRCLFMTPDGRRASYSVGTPILAQLCKNLRELTEELRKQRSPKT
jgi:hypothetical protein